MNNTARRALRATAALTGLATSFGLSGTALAATPTDGGTALAQLPSNTAPSDTGASLTAPTSGPSSELHSFQMPSMQPSRHHNHDGDDDGVSDRHSVERQDNSHKYGKQQDDNPGYKALYNRESKHQLKDSSANNETGLAQCHDYSNTSYSYGYNGKKSHHKPNSDDYDPDCDGYHPVAGSNNHDDGSYQGTDSRRRHDDNYQFGGLL